MTGKQLDLFEGVLLTADQQEKVNTYIENCKKNSEYTQKKHLNIVGLLLINGFCKDTHFEESCKTTIETRTVKLGYTYNNTDFETEVTAEYSQSDIYLLEHQKKTNLEKNTIEKYTKLYPNATIEAKDDWSKYGGSYRIVEVKFESGSYVQFKLDTYNLKEYLYKKHDAEFEKLTTEELLDRFSKQ